MCVGGGGGSVGSRGQGTGEMKGWTVAGMVMVQRGGQMERYSGGGMGRSWYWLVCRVKVKERSRMMLGLSWVQDGATLCCSGEHREEVSLRRSVWDILCLSVWVGVSQERRGTTGRRRKEIVSSLGLAQEKGVVAGECQRNELALVEKMRHQWRKFLST